MESLRCLHHAPPPCCHQSRHHIRQSGHRPRPPGDEADPHLLEVVLSSMRPRLDQLANHHCPQDSEVELEGIFQGPGLPMEIW